MSDSLCVGSWLVNRLTNTINRDGNTVRLDARAMDLLLYLADRQGQTVGVNELLDQVWAGVIVTQDSVYQAVASLRRELGDDAKSPRYIATVPRQGYRLIALVRNLTEAKSENRSETDPTPAIADSSLRSSPSVVEQLPGRAMNRTTLLLTVAFGIFVIAALFGINAGAPKKSIGVMPFLDLTSEEMHEEYFADGLTEELIDRLSQVKDFQVPGPASSFYYKANQVPVEEFGRALRVTFVLSGSIRESDGTLYIATRLVRAKDGYVVWSQSFEQHDTDRLLLQKEIAAEVTKKILPFI